MNAIAIEKVVHEWLFIVNRPAKTIMGRAQATHLNPFGCLWFRVDDLSSHSILVYGLKNINKKKWLMFYGVAFFYNMRKDDNFYCVIACFFFFSFWNFYHNNNIIFTFFSHYILLFIIHYSLLFYLFFFFHYLFVVGIFLNVKNFAATFIFLLSCICFVLFYFISCCVCRCVYFCLGFLPFLNLTYNFFRIFFSF